LAILIAAGISIFGQSKDEQAIRQHFSEMDAMLVKDEAGAFERFTAADFIFVGTGGVCHSGRLPLARQSDGQGI